MSHKANVNAASLSAWNKKVALTTIKRDALNRDPIDVTKDQIRQLYVILYPFIAADFLHRTDNEMFEEKIHQEMKDKINDFNNKIKQWVSTQLNMHQHIGNNGAPVSPPSAVKAIGNMPELDLWETTPENGNFTNGEDHIVKANKMIKSKNIKHRDKSNNKKIKTKYLISNLLSGGNILIPFDINDSNTELSSNENFGENL